MACNDMEEDDGVHKMLDDFENFMNNYHMGHDNGVSDLNVNDGSQDTFAKLLQLQVLQIFSLMIQFRMTQVHQVI